MKPAESNADAAARIGAALGRRKRAELLGLLRPCFVRTEPWLQAGRYAAAVMSDLRRRNGWTIAERSGDGMPDRTQRLLNRAVWDTFAAMGVVRQFAVAGLDEAARKTGRRRGHQARSHWYHQRTRLARRIEIALVRYRMAAAVLAQLQIIETFPVCELIRSLVIASPWLLLPE